MVSVVIPVYQVSEYIERCIRSVMAQSYTCVECIIVDDDTQDDSIEKCERLIGGYSGTIFAFCIMRRTLEYLLQETLVLKLRQGNGFSSWIVMTRLPRTV